MAEKFDVIVVGAGPAGSAAAKKCVDGGLKTLLIDKHNLPRRKACSGIICNVTQNYILENFGPIPAKTFGKPYAYRGMGFWFPSVGMVYSESDCYNMYVWRDKFDHWLATSSGADLRDNVRFMSVEDKGDKVIAAADVNGAKEKYEGKYLIGADGGNSHVVRNIAPEIYHGMPFMFACQKYYEGEVDADDRYLHWYLTTGMGPFPWLNVKDDQIIIGQAVQVGEKFKPNFEAFLSFLKSKFGLKIKKELAVEGCIANMMTPLNRFFPGRGRVLMVGDACGLMHQGGEGISCAVASGGYAGSAIIKAMGNGVDALQEYKKAVRPEMETALDQFNLFRMMSTAASDNSRQPSLFHELNRKQKALALMDFVKFLKSEFSAVTGVIPTTARNMIRRQLKGDYYIPSVDS